MVMSGIKRYYAKERDSLQKQALDKATKPIADEALRLLMVNGRLATATFKDNIAKIFPRILLMAASGQSIKHIEAFIGVKERVLVDFLAKHKRCHKAVKDARRLNLDKRHELKFMLS